MLMGMAVAPVGTNTGRKLACHTLYNDFDF
jgi:hypothetical protein